jgi:Flp pilus assembly pilin Flp
MLKFFAFLQNFLAEPARRDDRGVTSVEYAIIITVLGIGLIATFTAFNTALRNLFVNFIGAL